MKVNVGSKSINASLSTLTLLEFVRISNVLTKKTTDVLAWRDLFVSMVQMCKKLKKWTCRILH